MAEDIVFKRCAGGMTNLTFLVGWNVIRGFPYRQHAIVAGATRTLRLRVINLALRHAPAHPRLMTCLTCIR